MLPLNKLRGALVERGIKGVDIAKRAHVSNITVSIVLTGKGKSMHIQKTIAEMLDMPYEKIWGHEYKPRRKAA